MLNAMTRVFPLKTAEYTARLMGQAGFTGRGVLFLAFMSHGGVEASIDLRGIAGTKAELWIAGRHVIDIPLKNGRALMRFSHKKLLRDLTATEGDIVDVHQNGDVILRGSLVHA